jgi:hypothetical protein
MNSKVVYAFLLALTLLIVLPVHSTVNATPAQHASSNSVFVTDGSPGPPPVPPLAIQQEPLLVADGSPGPPPVPPLAAPQEPLLVADGSPGPPPVPPLAMPQEPLLVADGSPGPPPVPPMQFISELKAA